MNTFVAQRVRKFEQEKVAMGAMVCIPPGKTVPSLSLSLSESLSLSLSLSRSSYLLYIHNHQYIVSGNEECGWSGQVISEKKLNQHPMRYSDESNVITSMQSCHLNSVVNDYLRLAQL